MYAKKKFKKGLNVVSVGLNFGPLISLGKFFTYLLSTLLKTHKFQLFGARKNSEMPINKFLNVCNVCTVYIFPQYFVRACRTDQGKTLELYRQ